jgi:hypothetical protein
MDRQATDHADLRQRITMQPERAISVEERERAIFKYLKGLEASDGGATVRQIWETMREQLGEGVTQQAYYKLLDRLVAVGKLDVVTDPSADGGRRYIVAPHLNAENAVTLDDVYELIDTLEPSDAIARVIDAREYFEEKRADTLKRAAEALLEEDPRELVEALVLQKFTELQADLALLQHEELAERELEARVNAQFREFQLLVYRYLGLSRQSVDAARPEEIKLGKHELALDPQTLRKELKARVFGERAISAIDVSKGTDSLDWDRTTVSGSDASTHAGAMHLVSAQTFIDDVGHQVVTFNNSVVYVHAPQAVRERIGFPYYSVPLSRGAIDDPSNRGMVLAPFMYRYLSESEYEHMVKCATDVVQWRADEAVFLGTARSLADGTLLPRPVIHFRDGTITPQEREYGHYKRANEYGDMVREGIAHGRKILEKIIGGEAPPVFGGAVKVTQARFFSILLNWYIAKGSRKRLGAPLDPDWDSTRAAHIADNEAMSFLLSTLIDRRSEGLYYVSFAVMRPFHTLTEFFRTPRTPDHDWKSDFDERLEREMREYREGATHDVPWLNTVPDVADDDFVFLCRKADYVTFYIGHTAADPPPIAPRYEFLESLRPMGDPVVMAARVERNRRMIVAALHKTGFSADSEHNFLSRKFLVRIIPFVVYEAHEKCKALGRKLEAELRSIVVANLQGLRNARSLKPSDVQFLPVSIRRFVERYSRILKDEKERDPGRFER